MRRTWHGAAALLLASSAANAANWVEVARGGDRVMYIDMDSIRSNVSPRSAWTRTTYSGGPHSEFHALQYFDCARSQAALKSAVQYERDGTNSSYTWEDSELKWDPIVAGTLGEAAFQAACR